MSGRALFKDKQLRLCVVTTLATGAVVSTTEALLLPPKPLAFSSTWDCRSGSNNEWLCRTSPDRGYSESLESVARDSQKSYSSQAYSYHTPALPSAEPAYDMTTLAEPPTIQQPSQSIVADSAVLLELLNAPPENYVLQWLAANNREPLEKLKNRYPILQDATIAEYQRAGKQWYILLDGPYPSRIAAMAALKREPRSLIAGKFYPWTRSVASIQQLDLIRPEQLASEQPYPSDSNFSADAVAAQMPYNSHAPEYPSHDERDAPNGYNRYHQPGYASYSESSQSITRGRAQSNFSYQSPEYSNRQTYNEQAISAVQNQNFPYPEEHSINRNSWPDSGYPSSDRQVRPESRREHSYSRRTPEQLGENRWTEIPSVDYQQNAPLSTQPRQQRPEHFQYQQKIPGASQYQGQNSAQFQNNHQQGYGHPTTPKRQHLYSGTQPEQYNSHPQYSLYSYSASIRPQQQPEKQQTGQPDYNIQQSEYSDYGYNPDFYHEVQKPHGSAQSSYEIAASTKRINEVNSGYGQRPPANTFQAPPGSYTIQWLAANNKGSLERLQLRYPALQNTQIIHYRKRNSDWYVLVGGTFNSYEAAQKALSLPPLSRLTARLYPWVRSADGIQRMVAKTTRKAPPKQVSNPYSQPLEEIISGPGNYTIQWYAANRPEAVQRMKQRFPELASAVTVHFRRNQKDWYVLLQGQYRNSQEAISAIKSPAMRDAARLLHPWTRPVNTLRRLKIQEQS